MKRQTTATAKTKKPHWSEELFESLNTPVVEEQTKKRHSQEIFIFEAGFEKRPTGHPNTGARVWKRA